MVEHCILCLVVRLLILITCCVDCGLVDCLNFIICVCWLDALFGLFLWLVVYCCWFTMFVFVYFMGLRVCVGLRV